MGMKYIDAKMLQKAFLAGAKGLEAKKEWINELNVSSAGWRYRNQHDHDDHGSGKGSGCH